MSRLDAVNYENPVAPRLWDYWFDSVLHGKRGRRILAELEAALLALPEKRLLYDNLALGGQVCAVGAWIAARDSKRTGEDWGDTVQRLEDEFTGDIDVYGTAREAKYRGMPWTLAWELITLNDETLMSATPEERYERVLAKVREWLDEGRSS